MPPRRESDAMLIRFWTRVHPLFPFLDKCSFDRWYQELWTAEDDSSGAQRQQLPLRSVDRRYPGSKVSPPIPESRILHCILNVVFALGCKGNGLQGRSQRSDLYWQRCKRLLQLDFDIFSRGCLSLVQALLLMALYLQSTELTGACWNVVGVATRVAQGIGLHSSPTSSQDGARLGDQTPSQLTSENALRSRVWSGCVLMDR